MPYDKMSPRKTMASGGGGGKAAYSGLPKKNYPDKMDGDGAPKPKGDVTAHYPQSKLLGKATADGMDGDKNY